MWQGCRTGLLLWLMGATAQAAQWNVTGVLGQAVSYNDNFFLAAQRPQSAVGYLLMPKLGIGGRGETWSLAVQGQADIRRYDHSDWDCDNFSLNTENRYVNGRAGFQLNGGYTRTCTYLQQLNDTGILTPNTQFESYNVAPAWTWQWTQRDQLEATATYLQTDYLSGQAGTRFGFSGNQTFAATLAESHALNPRWTLTGKLFFSQVHFTRGNSPDQQIGGLQVGGSYSITPLWRTTVLAGPLWASQHTSDGGVVENGSTFVGDAENAELRYRGVKTQFSAGFAHSVNPSAIGYLTENYLVTTGVLYDLTRRVTLSLNGNYQKVQSIGDTALLDRSYYLISTSLGWEFLKHWQLRLSYQHQWQQFQKGPNGTADANTVMLTLTYDLTDLFHYSR